VTDQARLDAVVHGRVHGVGFRVFVRRLARAAGLSGWVANEPSGRVHVVAEGARADLERLLDEIRVGPPAAFVERVEASWAPPSGDLDGFDVRSGWHGGD
jgi:acylphosphatase